jgi:hypothetical protein
MISHGINNYSTLYYYKEIGIKFTSESPCKPVWHSDQAADVTMCITLPDNKFKVLNLDTGLISVY